MGSTPPTKAELAAVLAGAVTIVAVTIYLAWFFLFGIGTCHAFDDTGGGGLEDESVQGKICGYSSEPTRLPWLALLIPFSGVVAVGLVIRAWSTPSTTARLVAAASLLLLPVLAVILLSIPPNR